MLEGVDFMRLFVAILLSPEPPWSKHGTSKYVADVEREAKERQKVIADLMAKYERDRAANRDGD